MVLLDHAKQAHMCIHLQQTTDANWKVVLGCWGGEWAILQSSNPFLLKKQISCSLIASRPQSENGKASTLHIQHWGSILVVARISINFHMNTQLKWKRNSITLCYDHDSLSISISEMKPLYKGHLGTSNFVLHCP